MKVQLLKSFIAFLIFNAAFLISTKGQIVYTDVNPDVTVNTNGGVYPLDVNNDGITDFNIAIQTGNAGAFFCTGTKPYAQVIITPVAGNFVETISGSPSALIAGAIIDSAITYIYWSSGAYSGGYMALDHWACLHVHVSQPHWQHSTVGHWLNATDKYLGLKFTKGGNTHYGWARLNAQVTSNATATFTIKDYAYNSTPNQPILADQTTTAGIIENISSNHFSIYSFNKTLNIKLDNVTPLNGNITICNTLGQELKQIKIENSTMQIDMSDCNSGIYFVSVQTNEAIETKKIYLK